MCTVKSMTLVEKVLKNTPKMAFLNSPLNKKNINKYLKSTITDLERVK